MGHGAVVRRVNGLADAGLLPLHQAQLVHGVVHPQGEQLVPGEPLPGRHARQEEASASRSARGRGPRTLWILLPSPFGVKEEHQEELVALLRFPPLPQLEDLHGRHWNGDAVVKEPFLGHVRVNDLQQYDTSVRDGPGLPLLSVRDAPPPHVRSVR